MAPTRALAVGREATMHVLELTDSETRLLGEAVELRLREMRNELVHTDDRAYRAALKERLERLETIGRALGVKPPEVPHLGSAARM